MLSSDDGVENKVAKGQLINCQGTTRFAVMLRIGIHDDGERTTFSIEGKLTVPSSIELEKCWHEAKTSRPPGNIVVKLKSVTFIDSDSRELLKRMRRQGVKLLPTGCLMNSIVEQIESEVS